MISMLTVTGRSKLRSAITQANYIDVDCSHVTLNEFVQYASLCPPLGAYCYSFSSNVFRGVSPGYYTVNSYQEVSQSTMDIYMQGVYCY
jgi:hypothetical protein